MMRGMLVGVAVVAFAGNAAAQAAAVGQNATAGQAAAAAAPAIPAKPADPNQAWEPSILLQPLQLSLTAPDLMPGARYTPGCDEAAEYNGNSAGPNGNGLPLMRSLGYQLSPRLSILAFSRLGCTTTAGLGGAAAYAVPLARKVSFVLSGGTFAMPQVLDRGTALKTIFRAAVVWKGDGQIVSHTGIEALNIRGGTSTSKVGLTYGFSF